jgi:hypothetical protein
MADSTETKSSEADLDGGVAASHAETEPRPLLVAPTLEVAVNTVRAFLIPVGCWRLDDLRFDFDSSFVRASAKKEMGLLNDLIKKHPKAPLSIFGHADPVGDDTYNKTLSGRRARAIFAMLIRDVAAWEDLFSNSFGGDKWGVSSVQRMLFALGETVDHSGFMDGKTTSALKSFQGKKGLAQTGKNDAATREALFTAYMDLVCSDAGGAPYKLTKADFLARGADPDGKGDFQGCGEFNPVLMFSQGEKNSFGKTKRDQENAPNRRVMALLFRPGTVVDPGRWPCPSFKADGAGCEKRFWSDAKTRRQFQAKRRTFEDDRDTYACRFYQRLFELSPCAGGAGPGVITVMQVKASVKGTRGVRNKSNERATSVLTASTSAEEALDKNPPVILVRGCNEVDLEAVTLPAAPVTWTVKPNENSNPAPTITPTGGGRKAVLKTDQGGSFSVIASTGASKVVWNVVFVSVNVDTSSAVALVTDKHYADNNSNGTFTQFESGSFPKKTFAWDITVSKVELVGGGSKGDIGIDKVRIRYLQNGIADTLTGNYEGGGTALEVPKGGLPIVDSNGNAGGNPTADLALEVKPNNTAAVRSVRMFDSPAGAFPRKHPNTNKLLVSISGINGFTAAVGSTSDEAPNAFVAHAKVSWHADYKGDVTKTGPVGKYTPNGAKTVADTTIALISPATGGQDAGVAGFDLFEPRFNGGTDTKFTP